MVRGGSAIEAAAHRWGAGIPAAAISEAATNPLGAFGSTATRLSLVWASASPAPATLRRAVGCAVATGGHHALLPAAARAGLLATPRTATGAAGIALRVAMAAGARASLTAPSAAASVAAGLRARGAATASASAVGPLRLQAMRRWRAEVPPPGGPGA